MLPELVRERCGDRRSRQLGAFIGAVVDATVATGEVGMAEPFAEALAAFRAFNYELIYMRPASVAQGEVVAKVLRALVEFYADRPNAMPEPELAGTGHHHDGSRAGSEQAVREAVSYVAGMTDRFAFAQAVAHLGWDPSGLPTGLDVGR